jgi:hypothetical protein
VEFAGAVESLNERFVFAVGFACGIAVAQADDGAFAESVLFPSKECAATVRAPVSGFTFPSGLMRRRGPLTDFTLNLRAEPAVVEIKTACRSVAVGADTFFRRKSRAFTSPNFRPGLPCFRVCKAKSLESPTLSIQTQVKTGESNRNAPTLFKEVCYGENRKKF